MFVCIYTDIHRHRYLHIHGLFGDHCVCSMTELHAEVAHTMLLEREAARYGVIGLPKGSKVAPFWACYGFWARDYDIRPEKEPHRRV